MANQKFGRVGDRSTPTHLQFFSRHVGDHPIWERHQARRAIAVSDSTYLPATGVLIAAEDTGLLRQRHDSYLCNGDVDPECRLVAWHVEVGHRCSAAGQLNDFSNP